MGGMLFAYLSQVPLFLIGLGLGLTPAIIAGALPTAVVGGVGNLFSALLFVGSSVAPVLLIVRQALLNRPGPNGVPEWYPAGRLTVWLSALTAAGIVTAALVMGELGRALCRERVCKYG